MAEAAPHRYPCAVAHIGLAVPDLDRAVDWYCDVLGCQLLGGPDALGASDGHAGRAASAVFGPGFGHVRVAHVTTAGSVAIELFEFQQPKFRERGDEADYWSAGFTHLCLVEPNIEMRVEAITASGGRARTGIWELFPGEPYRFCHCEDPFGNIIELFSHSHEQVFANRR